MTCSFLRTSGTGRGYDGLSVNVVVAGSNIKARAVSDSVCFFSDTDAIVNNCDIVGCSREFLSCADFSSEFRLSSMFPRLFKLSGRSGWSAGVNRTASSAFSNTISRSAICPVRSYRLSSLFPRLFNKIGRSGWSAGVRRTAFFARNLDLVMMSRGDGRGVWVSLRASKRWRMLMNRSGCNHCRLN
jgi:hypothetical protein